MEYRALTAGQIGPGLLDDFARRQEVDLCWRGAPGAWRMEPHPFVDDWTPAERRALAHALRRMAAEGGLVLAAFDGASLAGFAAVAPRPIGPQGRYRDLVQLHVGLPWRRQGVGRRLFLQAAAWARQAGGEALYISAHSAAQTQAFYRALGCVDAQYRHAPHVQAEPFDCQLEYPL